MGVLRRDISTDGGIEPYRVVFRIDKTLNLSHVRKDVPRGTILELVKKGHVHHTDIEKKAVATCLRFATSNTVRKQFYHYLLVNGYVERVSRGIYRITLKGEKLLEILN